MYCDNWEHQYYLPSGVCPRRPLTGLPPLCPVYQETILVVRQIEVKIREGGGSVNCRIGKSPLVLDYSNYTSGYPIVIEMSFNVTKYMDRPSSCLIIHYPHRRWYCRVMRARAGGS